MRNFSISLKGRVKNFNLPKNQPLIPLFEAIVNSIHAINERKNAGEQFNAYITINLIRDNQLALELDGMKELSSISSFEIVDNYGIGLYL